MDYNTAICRTVFLSTLSLRRATLFAVHVRAVHGISIHALLAESDALFDNSSPEQQNFYPRSPCGERRSKPARNSGIPYFYPRSPCGERHFTCAPNNRAIAISIHALLAESDRPKG